MKGDFTRSTFKPEKHYSGVRMQQGRVLLDADFNEHVDIQAHLAHTSHRDIIGPCGGPQGVDSDGKPLAGFQIKYGRKLRVTKGRYYVDGILCENEADVAITDQPDLPVASLADLIWPPPSEAEPGRYLAYLDVWQRHVTALEDEAIREVALRGPDTTTRTKTVAQVKLLRVGDKGDDSLDCASELEAWQEATAPSSGRLRAQAEPEASETDACEVPAGAGYRGLENQLYRVEVHSVESEDEITFKWSRENGSVVVRWEEQDGDKLTVSSVGRDDVLGFAPDDWIELTDDGRELRGESGLLVQIIKVDGKVLTIDSHGQTVNFDDFEPTRKVRRWDMPGDTGAITVHLTEADNWIDLEKGVQVAFEPGSYRVGDYWLIPARTATRDVEWPRAGDDPLPQPPHGIHHYCRLALLDFDGANWERVHDCRKLFPPLTEMIRFVYVSGDGQETLPSRALTWPLRVGVLNGQTPVAGAVVEFRVVSGDGRLRAWNPSVPTCTAFTAGGATNVEVVTEADGIAACCWRPRAGVWQQQVEARLLEIDGKPLVDADGNPLLTPIRFNANLSLASQVYYDSGACINPHEPNTVQEALDDLCRNWALYYVSGDGQEAGAGETLPQPLQVRVANGQWPVPGAKVAFEIVRGNGSLNATTVESDENGLAECRWTLGTIPRSQRVEAYLVEDERRLSVGFNASLAVAAKEDGVHIEDVAIAATGSQLANGEVVALGDVAKNGIVILCDQVIDAETASRPTCFVTVEFPMITRVGDGPLVPVGYYIIVLASKVDSHEQRIRWRMSSETATWLQEQLDNLAEQGINRLLARLTLKGNFIWALDSPGLYLDGNAFGLPSGVTGTNLRLPSGDGKRGGDFEMWFWLASQPEQPATGWGLIPNVGTDVLSDPRTDDMFNLAIRRDALQEVLPQGYVVDSSQAFDPDKAGELADEIGIRGAELSVLVSQSLARAAKYIQGTLTEHDIVTWNLNVVDDGDMMTVLAVQMAGGDPTDIVIGSDGLRANLAGSYPNSFSERFVRF